MIKSIGDFAQDILAGGDQIPSQHRPTHHTNGGVENFVFFRDRNPKIECDAWDELVNSVTETKSNSDRSTVDGLES